MNFREIFGRGRSWDKKQAIDFEGSLDPDPIFFFFALLYYVKSKNLPSSSRLFHCWRSTTISCINDLHWLLSQTILVHSATVLFVQSLTSSIHRCLGLPRRLFPLICPSNISMQRYLTLTTWPNYVSFRFLTVVIRHSVGWMSCNTELLVRCSVQLILSILR